MLNNIADKILAFFKPNKNTKKIAIVLTSVMFIWSGVNKVNNFEKKISTLVKKTGWPEWFSILGMILVILLEIIGFIILIDYFVESNVLTPILSNIIDKKKLTNIILLSVILFIALVTVIYHPPEAGKMIPFLNNLSLFGLFLYLYADNY